MQVEVKRITGSDDLRALVELINRAEWDDANDVDPYSLPALQAYLMKEDTVFVAAFSAEQEVELVGMASGRIQLKPYEQMKWLYIDEVDTCANQRRKGVGRLMMQYLLQIARENSCEEVWLGTEQDNEAALALYKTLGPDETESFVGFTWDIN